MTEESKPSGSTSPEQAVEQARALNEQILEAARNVGQEERYVDCGRRSGGAAEACIVAAGE